jgi:hypothetical protein
MLFCFFNDFSSSLLNYTIKAEIGEYLQKIKVTSLNMSKLQDWAKFLNTQNWLYKKSKHSCLILSDPIIWSSLILSDPIWSYLILSDPIWSYLILSDPIWSYLILSDPIW